MVAWGFTSSALSSIPHAQIRWQPLIDRHQLRYIVHSERIYVFHFQQRPLAPTCSCFAFSEITIQRQPADMTLLDTYVQQKFEISHIVSPYLHFFFFHFLLGTNPFRPGHHLASSTLSIYYINQVASIWGFPEQEKEVVLGGYGKFRASFRGRLLLIIFLDLEQSLLPSAPQLPTQNNHVVSGVYTSTAAKQSIFGSLGRLAYSFLAGSMIPSQTKPNQNENFQKTSLVQITLCYRDYYLSIHPSIHLHPSKSHLLAFLNKQHVELDFRERIEKVR